MLQNISEIKLCLELAGQSYDAYRVRQNRPSIEGKEGGKRRKKTSGGRENLHNECLEKNNSEKVKDAKGS